ncbi:subclass B1 metallo-beta-lactamase [Thalassotalea profundi]|uniref:beta-lactamase n=1 Tax=Thalassotalea profundi TaxID=2036687 RepID=A0ABQ3J1Q0_9GAMM|nr:subclass B1 metallo-beta-lactamase [Thalassotalea profundi]GHE98168.1 beta-lactamase [Thalassotalea profundi]
MKYIIFLFSVITFISLANEKIPQTNVTQLDVPQLKIVEISNDVYQHISYKHVKPWGMVAASGLVVIDGNDAYIIDTPWSLADTQQLIKWIKSKGLKLKASVVTHFHEDASAGIPILNRSKIKTYALSLTNELLALNNKEQSSDEIISDNYVLVPNTIEIFYPGAGHSHDNIVVWLPKSKVLFGGCFVKSIESKNLGNTADASISSWPKSIEKVISQYPDINIVVPGHGKIGDINLLKHTALLARDKSML